MRILITIAIMLSLLVSPVNCLAAENRDSNEALTENTDELTYYLEEDAYLYTDTTATTFVGKILKGTKIQVIANNNGMAYVNYADQSGYIKADLLSANYPEDSADDTETVTVTDSSNVEQLYPSSHYFDSYNYEAINALAQYTADGRDDNYVIVCNPDPIVINGGELAIAESNGVSEVTIQYSSDKQHPDIYLAIPTAGAQKNLNMDLSFTYSDVSVEFNKDRFEKKIKIGFPSEKFENITMGDKTYTADEDGMIWIETDSPETITFTVIKADNSINNIEESTEIVESDTPKEKNVMHLVWCGVAGAAITLVAVFAYRAYIVKKRRNNK